MPNIFIYELPYTERKEFCNIIDINDKWEELGNYINLTVNVSFGIVKLINFFVIKR